MQSNIGFISFLKLVDKSCHTDILLDSLFLSTVFETENGESPLRRLLRGVRNRDRGWRRVIHTVGGSVRLWNALLR